MEQGNTQIFKSYKAAFARFRAHQLEQFRVKVRRKRAAQLKFLLSTPETVNLKFFNEEVWRIERGTFVRGSGKPWTIFTSDTETRQGLTPAEIQFLDQALDACGLELHGNYCWGSGSRIYAPMLRDDAEKERNIQQALRILICS